jgi:hypothetical protein
VALISDQLLNNVRSVAYKQLVTPATIKRKTRVETANGVENTVAPVATLNCWVVVRAAGAMQIQPAGHLTETDQAEIRFRITDDVRVNDVIVVAGKQWTVQSTNDEATITVFLRAFCKRVGT